MRARFRQFAIGAAAAGLLALLGFILVFTGPPDPFRTIDSDIIRIAKGRAIYAAHCARCHGAELQGQPDWKSPLPSGRLPAPPHDATGHTWHHPDHILIGITKNGLKPYAGEDYESDMPAFGAVLSDDEIAALWAFIKSTWPERERDYQRRVTLQAQAQKRP